MSQNIIQFNVLCNAKIPIKSTTRASCYDLFSYGIIYDLEYFLKDSNNYNTLENSSYSISGYKSTIIRTGISVVMPENVIIDGQEFTYGIEVKSRSGLAFKNNVEVFHGEIDNDYHKEILLKVSNNSNEIFEIKKDMKIAQMRVILIPLLEEVVNVVNDLNGTERNGFGSTGL